MKRHLFFLLVVFIGCTNFQTDQAVKISEPDKNPASINADSIQVVAIVKEFFKPFDERDLQKMNDLLDPAIKIIHHNGATTNREEMIQIHQQSAVHF